VFRIGQKMHQRRIPRFRIGNGTARMFFFAQMGYLLDSGRPKM
jgi:hypothetical protein